MAWGRALTGIRFARIHRGELPDFLRGNVEMTRALREFFRHTDDTEHAVAAMRGRQCVGLFAFYRFEYRPGKFAPWPWLQARGTYVCREYRKCGLARLLWQRAIAANPDCEYVRVDVVAKAGRKLVEAVARENTDIVFRIKDQVTQEVSVLRVA